MEPFRQGRLAVIALVLSGCATVQPVAPSAYAFSSINSEHKIETNYQIGAAQEAFVGESMIRVRDYYVTTGDSGVTNVRLIPTENFSIRLPPLMMAVNISSQDLVQVVGTTSRGGITYRVVQLPNHEADVLRFLIADDGAFEGSAINWAGSRMGWSFVARPDTVRLVPAPSELHIDSTRGHVNFELVYSGATRDAFQLLYREYTEEDRARPAFAQSLTYDKAGQVIRFRDLQIRVDEASNDRIRFAVLSDGSGRPPGKP